MAKITAFFLSVISFFLTLFGLPGYQSTDKVDMSKFELTWSDEFDGDSIDRTKWQDGWWPATATSLRRGGFWNGKLCEVKDGALHIAIRYYENGLDGGEAGWYSSQLTTQGLFEQKYGYFETRCILPKGTGLWSTFWLLCNGAENENGNGKDGSEIDIFEAAYYYDENNRNTVSSTIHYDGYGNNHKQETVHRTHIYENNPYENYNTYGLEWNENGYTFYINGKKCGTSDFGGVSEVPEYLLLSVEVGGDNGIPSESWAGKSIETNASAPTDFIVDYVRVYQYK